MKCLETICMKCQICFVLFFVWGVGGGGGGGVGNENYFKMSAENFAHSY